MLFARIRVDVFFPWRAKEYVRKTFENQPNDAIPLVSNVDPTFPVVIFAYGGAWSTGYPWMYGPIGRVLAEKCGVIALIADYRTYPNGLIEDQVSDLQSIVSFSRKRFPQRRVVLLAHSSGAHTASLAALTSSEIITVPDALILTAGPYHLGRHVEYEDFRGIASVSPMCPNVGGQKNLCDYSPTVKAEEETLRLMSRKITASKLRLEGDIAGSQIQLLPKVVSSTSAKGTRIFPETFLLCSGADDIVPFYSSVRFANALRNSGADCRLLVYEAVSHSDFIMDWMRPHFKDKRSIMLGSVMPEPNDMTIECPADWEPFSPHIRDVFRIIKSASE